MAARGRAAREGTSAHLTLSRALTNHHPACSGAQSILAQLDPPPGDVAAADVAVIGARHEKRGETPVAVVVPADSAAPPTLEDLTGWMAGRLACYKKPTGLAILDELPRNASGKVLKHELRAR